MLAVALGLAAALPTTLAPAPAAAESGELAAARRELLAARTRAREAAVAYLAMTAELARIERARRAVARDIPPMRDRVDRLQDVLRDRSAELYKDAARAAVVPFEMVDAAGVVDAERVRRIADAVQHRDDVLVGQFAAYLTSLRAREQALVHRTVQQRAAVAFTERATAELETAVDDASRAVRRLEQIEALRAYQAALAAQQAAAAAALAAAAADPAAPPPPPAVVQRAPASPELAATVPVDLLACPVDGAVTFTDDWGNPRPNWRVHQGTDVFAPRGTPNVAVADGLLRRRIGGLGGNAVWVEADDGTFYYYAHLDRFEGAFAADGTRRVGRGEVVGYTGNTGNAAGGPSHTHFEIHPKGAGPINPYPILAEICAAQAGL